MPVPSLGKSTPRGADLNLEAMLPSQSTEEAERERSAAAQLRVRGYSECGACTGGGRGGEGGAWAMGGRH